MDFDICLCIIHLNNSIKYIFNMDTYVENPIFWENFIPYWWLDRDKSFEYLCAKFLRIYLDLDVEPTVSQNDIFPGIEWIPFEYNWHNYWFQSKMWDDAFKNSDDKWFWKSFKTIKSSLNNDTYKLDKLFLFSANDYPQTSKTNKEGFEKRCNSLKKECWIEVEWFYWEAFLNELKKIKYWDLINIFFNSDKAKTEIRNKIKNNETHCPSLLEDELNKVDWFFLGNEKQYDKDKQKAKNIQKKYSINKLKFINYPWIIELFDEVEKKIYDETSYLIGYENYNSLREFEDYFFSEINKINSNPYDKELNELIQKRWLIINYWTQGYYNLFYKDKEDIEESEWIIKFNNLKNE